MKAKLLQKIISVSGILLALVMLLDAGGNGGSMGRALYTVTTEVQRSEFKL